MKIKIIPKEKLSPIGEFVKKALEIDTNDFITLFVTYHKTVQNIPPEVDVYVSDLLDKISKSVPLTESEIISMSCVINVVRVGLYVNHEQLKELMNMECSGSS